jgi:alkylhydroperoxidase family enzyme
MNGRPEWNGIEPTQLLARFAPDPALREAFLGLGDALHDQLPARWIELVALRCGVVRDCLYEWRGHVKIARDRPDDALTELEIALVATGPEAWTSEDALVLMAVDELLLDRHLSAATERALGPERALRVELAVAFYDAIATLMHGAAPDEPPIQGLESPAAARRSLRR